MTGYLLRTLHSRIKPSQICTVTFLGCTSNDGIKSVNKKNKYIYYFSVFFYLGSQFLSNIFKLTLTVTLVLILQSYPHIKKM